MLSFLFSSSRRAVSRALLSSSSSNTPEFKLLESTFPSEALSDPVRRALSLRNARASERRNARASAVARAFEMHEADCGSTRVQVARLTVEINALKEHLDLHRKDFSSGRGYLLKMNKRKRLLEYLKRKDSQGYVATMEALDLPIPKTKSKRQGKV
ncbi:hypothetical protein CTAYLR_002939 [Chrysophaeum taylorii]|uniref:30S ribosomal protein S15 n=1 Tax=Chrysophaeum taylorii TaxID=2483200 RepID=A0AAD7XPQ1_9STRA|nr:hypothetical protein CTAYLR_002939 [Chrysophaeum taylorii]